MACLKEMDPIRLPIDWRNVLPALRLTSEPELLGVIRLHDYGKLHVASWLSSRWYLKDDWQTTYIWILKYVLNSRKLIYIDLTEKGLGVQVHVATVPTLVPFGFVDYFCRKIRKLGLRVQVAGSENLVVQQGLFDITVPMPAFEELSGKIGRSLDNLEAKVDFGLQFATLHAGEGLNFFKSKVNNAFSGITVTSTVTSLVLKFVAMVRARFDPIVVFSLVLDALLAVGHTYQLATWIVSQLSDKIVGACRWCENLLTGTPIQQGNDDVGPIVGFVTAIMSLVTAGKFAEMEKQTWEAALSRIALLGRAVTGIEKIIVVLKAAWEFVYNWMYEKIFGIPRELEGDYHVVIADQYKEIQELLNVTNGLEIAKDTILCDKIVKLYRQSVKQFTQLSRLKGVPSTVVTIMRTQLMMLQKEYEKVLKSPAYAVKGRVEPLIVAFEGHSGIGKSGLQHLVAVDLLKTLGKTDWESEMYFRNPNQDFHDGYTGQDIYVMDDFGQMRDSETTPNMEFLDLIRMGNISAYPLHMADLESKANTYFNSKVVLASINQVHLKIKSLTHPEAVLRRFDHIYRVTVKPEYQIKVATRGGFEVRLDCAKVKKDFPDMPLADQIYMFEELNRDTLTATGYLVDYNTMIEQLREELALKMSATAGLRNFLDRRVRAPVIEPVDVTETLDAPVFADDGTFPRPVTPPPYVKDFFARAIDIGGITFGDDPIPVAQMMYDDASDVSFTTTDGDEDELRPRVRIIQNDANPQLEELGLLETSLRGVFVPPELPSVARLWTPDIRNIWLRSTSLPEFFHEAVLQLSLSPDLSVYVEAPENRPKKIVTMISEEMKTWKMELEQFVKEHPFTVGGTLIGAALAAIGVYYAVRDLYKEPDVIDKIVQDVDTTVERVAQRVESKVEVESVGGDSSRTIARVRRENSEESAFPNGGANAARVRRESKLTVPIEPTMESISDSNADELINNKVLRGLYTVYGVNPNREPFRLVNLLFVKGRVALAPYHLFKSMKLYERVRLVGMFLTKGIELPVSSIQAYEIMTNDDDGKDACLLEFPMSVVPHADVVKHFAWSVDLSAFERVPAKLVAVRRVRDKVVPHLFEFPSVDAVDKTLDIHSPAGDRVTQIRGYYTYVGETLAGDCGSPLVAKHGNVHGKILGIHVAGSPGRGYASSITRNLLESALRQCAPVAQIAVPDLDNVTSEVVLERLPDGEVIPLGTSEFLFPTQSRTSFIPSDVAQFRKSVSQIAILYPVEIDGVLVDPMAKGLVKIAGSTIYIDQGLIDLAVADFKACLFTPHVAPLMNRKRILTFTEAVQGVAGDDCMTAINRQASAGYGWAQEARGLPGKSRWFGQDDYLPGDDVRDVVLERIAHAKEGNRTSTIWIDTLKDERRPKEKVALAKTRVFSAGQMDYLLATRMYFLGFVAHVMENRVHNEVAVGIDPSSAEWHHLAWKLKEKGPCVVAGDFVNYDGSLMPSILSSIVDVINEWYDDGDENALVRRVLAEEILSSVHVWGDSVYQWTHSQPSGNPLTVVINSMYNSIVMRLAYIRLSGGLIGNFRKDVSMVSYGDDNVLNISAAAIPWFNQETLAESLVEFGMKYTMEDKSESLVKYRTLEEITFLKRRFRFDDVVRRFVAPLDADTIYDMMLWVRDKLRKDEITRMNIETALREALFHGSGFYGLLCGFLRGVFHDRPDLRVALYPFEPYYLGLEQCGKPWLGALATWPQFQSSNARSKVGDVLNWEPTSSSGELFSSIDECVPLKSKDQLVWPTSAAHGVVTQQGKENTATNQRSEGDPASKWDTDYEQITTFLDDGDVMKYDAHHKLSSDFGFSDARNHTIEDWLGRPRPLGSAEWISTSAALDMANMAGPPLMTVTPAALFSSSGPGQKINGFMMARMNMHFRFFVNAQPFQSGKLYVAIVPFKAESANTLNRGGYRHARGITALKGVEIDAAGANSGELVIPYCGPNEGLLGSDWMRHTIEVYVLNGLSSGTLSVVCYGWCTDVELHWPTQNQLVVQQGLEEDTGKSATPDSGSTSARLGTQEPASTNASMAAVGRQGLMPRIVGETSRFVRGLLGKGVRWSKGGVPRENFRGFTKSTNELAVRRIVNIPGFGYTTSDMSDTEAVLGGSVSNEIVLDGSTFGYVKEDEMDINYICGHRSLVTKGTWTEGGGLNMRIRVQPDIVAYTAWVGNAFATYGSPMAYVSRLFRFWRGTLCFRISAVKCAAHSGRLRVSFDKTSAGPTPGMAYQWILDLRESADLEIKIPYVADRPWSAVGDDIGNLQITVVNPLERAQNTNPNVEINVWQWGEHMQFCCPDGVNGLPLQAAGIGAETLPPDTAPEPFLFEDKFTPPALVVSQGRQSAMNQVIGNESQNLDGFSQPLICTKDDGIAAELKMPGEIFTNLRQYIRRFGAIGAAVDGITVRNTSYFNAGVNIAAGNASLERLQVQSPLARVAWMYQLYAGSRRFKLFSSTPAIGQSVVSGQYEATTGATRGEEVFDGEATRQQQLVRRASGFTHYTNEALTPVHEVRVPFYNKARCHYVNAIGAEPVPIWWCIAPTGTPILEAAGEDFSFGCMISPPPMVTMLN